MKKTILLHDSSTNYPIGINIDMIALFEKSKDDDGKTYVYFKTPIQDADSNEYPMTIVNETVEKIHKLINE